MSEKPPTPLPQKPHTTTASLIFWGIFSSGAAICFWSRFAKSLETGNKDLYTSEGLVAVCASGLLLAVLFGSCPHLADATAEIISEKPAYNNSVRKGQGQSMAALKLKRLLRKAQVFWRISKK